MKNDPSEKCKNCRNIYQDMWQDRRELLEITISVRDSYCETCETHWGKCTETCTEVSEYNKIINKNKQFFKGLYKEEE